MLISEQIIIHKPTRKAYYFQNYTSGGLAVSRRRNLLHPSLTVSADDVTNLVDIFGEPELKTMTLKEAEKYYIASLGFTIVERTKAVQSYVSNLLNLMTQYDYVSANKLHVKLVYEEFKKHVTTYPLAVYYTTYSGAKFPHTVGGDIVLYNGRTFLLRDRTLQLLSMVCGKSVMLK